MKNKNTLIYGVISLGLVFSGCSKTISKENGTRLGQTEPPTSTPTGTPSTTPSPHPSASPTPTPSSTATPIGCEPGRLGDLPSYAIYSKEEANFKDGSLSRRVAGADVEISKAIVGYSLDANAARADLQAVHELGVSSVKVPNGKATYGKSFSTRKSSALGGFVKTPFSMTENLRKITQFSNACGGAPANTSLERTCVTVPKGSNPKPQICTLHIRGENSALNIAEVPLGMLAGTNILSVEVPASSTLVANIPRLTNAAFKRVAVIFPKGKELPAVYWNFPDADKLEFSETLFHGTVVAPDAAVTVCAQKGEAAFWSRTVSASKSSW